VPAKTINKNLDLIYTPLVQGIERLAIATSPAQMQAYVQYLQLLEKWNRIYNLTAVRDIADMIPHHILDSLSMLPYIQAPRILDVGTGAGLPGLILAIARPDWQWVLLDSNQKKTRFILQAIAELGLQNVRVVAQRIQQFEDSQGFDSIISRAYSELSLFQQHCDRLLTDSGCLLAMKGQATQTQQELDKIDLSAGQTWDCVDIDVPLLEAQRQLVIIGKAG